MKDFNYKAKFCFTTFKLCAYDAFSSIFPRCILVHPISVEKNAYLHAVPGYKKCLYKERLVNFQNMRNEVF